MLIINFDGACEPRNPGGWATFGWLARRGDVVVATGQGLAAQGSGATNNVAEYAGLIASLRWLVAEGQERPAEIRGDSQLVVCQVTGRWGCHAAHLKPLHREARDLMRELRGSVTLHWVRREENAEADELSRAAYREARARTGSRPFDLAAVAIPS